MVSLILIHLKLGSYLLDKNSGPGIYICIYSVSSVGVSLVAIMSGKVTLFISGISGSKEVFFVKFNDFLQIALGVDLNNVLIYKTVECKPGCK